MASSKNFVLNTEFIVTLHYVVKYPVAVLEVLKYPLLYLEVLKHPFYYQRY